MQQPIRRGLRWVVLWAGLGLWTGCGKRAGQEAGGAPPPPPTVTVAPAEQREVTEVQEASGRVEAVEAVEIRPRVSGYLTQVCVQAGDLVKKGQVLFVIDPAPKQSALERAEAEVERADARLRNAETEAKRADRLQAANAMAAEEADQRRSAMREAKASLVSAKAAADLARLEREWCEVRSPIDGQVGRALVTVGNNVSGSDGFTTVLTTVMSVDPVYVYAVIDEGTLLRFRRLLAEKKLTLDEQGRIAVVMALSDEPEFKRLGCVESLDNRIDPDTGSMTVRMLFPNADRALLPGMFARLRVPVGEKRARVVVPERVIGTDQDQKFVLTLGASNIVAYRPVKLGPLVDGMRVVTEGLSAGEPIIVNGIQRARPGMPVQPQAPGAAEATTPGQAGH
jgi:multidrug efflux system membrane fusion protein